MYLAAWNDGAYVFTSIMAIIITFGLIYLLCRSFLKERVKYHEEETSFIEGILSKNEIASSINAYISKVTASTPFGVISVDLDKFTEMINAFGEKEAKVVIERIAKTIRKMFPNHISIGRTGIDSFLILMKADYSKKDCVSMTNLLKTEIEKSITVYGDTSYDPSVTIAIAYYPIHGTTYKQLMNSLSLATYIGKRDGGSTIVIYSDEMSKTESENMEYYTQVKEAIKNREFVLYYQPIIDIENKTIYGAEGLLRWNHPKLGVLSPFKFINILEQTGDINWVGIWGIEELIKQYQNLKQLYANKNFQLSMNLSPKQLTNEKLAVEFQKVVKNYRINPNVITLEIVEFAMFEKLDVVKNNIKSLKELGFKIAVDGFALDQATISKIEDMPIDIIKLDRDFFENETNAFIKDRFTSILIDYAKEKDIRIVAEGIENYEMVNFAHNRKISLVQGYYFSKPVSSDEFIAYVKDEKSLNDKLNGKNATIEREVNQPTKLEN